MSTDRRPDRDQRPGEPGRGSPPAADVGSPIGDPLWDAVRKSYVEDGCSSQTVGEMYGLVPRTVRFHAQKGRWREMRARHRAASRRIEGGHAPDDPAEAFLAKQQAAQRQELLMDPSAALSQQSVAMRVQEALVRGASLEARRWQSVFAELVRNGPAMDRAFAGGQDLCEKTQLTFYRDLFGADGPSPRAAPAVKPEPPSD